MTPGFHAASEDANEDFNAGAWAELLSLFKSAGVAELVEVLVDDVPEQQRRHAEAIQFSDLAALRRIAHTLRGTSLQLGAEKLAELCAQAEAAAVAGERDQAVRLSAELIHRHAALVDYLRREAGKNATSRE